MAVWWWLNSGMTPMGRAWGACHPAVNTQRGLVRWVAGHNIL